jgi:hypothetical protein
LSGTSTAPCTKLNSDMRSPALEVHCTAPNTVIQSNKNP